MSSDNAAGIAPPFTYETVLSMVRPVRGLRILDVPAGSGGFAEMMSREGASCVAADINSSRARCPFVVCDMNRPLPFADGSFDVVTCVEGIEHTQNAFQLVAEFSRVLKPGGRLAASTPNMQNLRSRLKFLVRGTLFWFDPREIIGVGHVNVVPWFLLRHILEKSGFEVAQIKANRVIFPSIPAPVARLMQACFSMRDGPNREQNSPTLLNAEGLIVLARKISS